MYEYNDIIIYAIQIVGFQFIASPRLSMFAYNQILTKNPDWIAANPEITRVHPPPSSSISRFFGILLLAFLVLPAMNIGSSHFVSVAHYGSTAIFLIQHLIFDQLTIKRFGASVPALSIRSARMIPRKLSHFIPSAISMVVFALLGLNILGWTLYFAFNEIIESSTIKHFVAMLFCYSVGLTVVFYSIKRRPINADSESAAFYRKTEIGVSFLVFSCFVVIGFIKLVETAIGSPPLPARTVDYIFTLLPLLIFMWFCNNRTFRRLSDVTATIGKNG